MLKKRISKRKKDIPIVNKNFLGLSISNFAGLVFVVILTLLLSAIVSKTAILTNSIGAYFIGSVMISSIVVGFIASKKSELKGIVSGVVSSIIFSFIITILMLLFSRAQLSPKTIFLYIAIVICGTIGGIVGANTKRRK